MAATPIRRYQAAALSLRGIRSRKGSTLATTQAIQHHVAIQDQALGVLLRDYEQGLQIVGLLVEEEKLAERLRGVPRGERPELRQRLTDIRNCLQKLDRQDQS